MANSGEPFFLFGVVIIFKVSLDNDNTSCYDV